jgi:hypothetical protein
MCPNCGKELNLEESFCQNCGYKIEKTQTNYGQTRVENYYKKQWKGTNVFIGCSVFFIILAVVFFIFSISKLDLLIVLIGELSFIINALFFYYLSYIAQETHETNIMIEEMYKRGKN